MKRSLITVASATLLVGGAVLMTSTPALADVLPTSCEAHAATISGTGTVLGTAGNDVIVAGPGSFVVAGDGDDLVCLVGGGSVVAAQGGNDVVDTTAVPAGQAAYTDLGPGNDVFVGGPGADQVDNIPGVTTPGDESPGYDVISTGAGNDAVISNDGLQPNVDRIDLGPGNDVAAVNLPAGSNLAIAGGHGANALSLVSPVSETAGAWTVDLGSGRVGKDGLRRAQATGFTHLTEALGSATAVSVRGTKGADVVDAGTRFTGVATDPGRFSVDLRGGDDVLNLSYSRTPQSGRLDLGAGSDLLQFLGNGSVSADLRHHRLASDGLASYQLTHLESFRGAASDVRFTGDDGRNSASASGCTQELRGGGGNDSLQVRLDAAYPASAFCPAGVATRAILQGQGGRDLLVGSVGDDVLLGGHGVDTAVGHAGRDTCKAEHRHGCEIH